MKGPAVPGTVPGLHRRPELEGPADDALEPSAWPPSEATALLDRIRAGAPLVEVFRLVQSRTERAVLVDGETLGTLSLDVVRVEAAGAALGSLRVVELELAADADEGHEALLGELDAALRGMGGLRPDDRSKLEYALDLLANR
jgi:inorganic triphosphatase YgiF